MEIKGLNFVQTCDCCPEQYDVYTSKGEQVGYVRLRFGCLTCEYPDVGESLVYEASLDDDWTGCFENEQQREVYLNDIADRLLQRIAMKRMTKQEAIEYCNKHKVRYIAEIENGETEFNQLIKGLENKEIKPDELPDYGMDY